MPNYKHLTPDQHYIEAERLMGDSRLSLSADHTRALLMEAQVHATLAGVGSRGDHLGLRQEEGEVFGEWARCTQPLEKMTPRALEHFGINPEEWS